MSSITVIKTSEKVLLWLHRTNKTQVWLGDQLGVTRQSISLKLQDNSFTSGDIIKLSRLGCTL